MGEQIQHCGYPVTDCILPDRNSAIAQAEWEVVEAAVALSEQVDCGCFEYHFDISSANAGCNLLKAVDRLLSLRQEAEKENGPA